MASVMQPTTTLFVADFWTSDQIFKQSFARVAIIDVIYSPAKIAPKVSTPNPSHTWNWFVKFTTTQIPANNVGFNMYGAVWGFWFSPGLPCPVSRELRRSLPLTARLVAKRDVQKAPIQWEDKYGMGPVTFSSVANYQLNIWSFAPYLFWVNHPALCKPKTINDCRGRYGSIVMNGSFLSSFSITFARA